MPHSVDYEPVRDTPSSFDVRVAAGLGVAFIAAGGWMIGMYLDKNAFELSAGVAATGFGITFVVLARILFHLQRRN